MSFVLFALSGAVVLFAFGPGLWGVIWTVVAGLAVVGSARIAFGMWLPVSPAAATVLVAGAALSGAVDASLRDWALTRFGYFDPDFLGVTWLFFAVVVSVAVAGFAALIAPLGAALPPALAVAGAVLTSIVVLVKNLPGLSDGIDAESIGPTVAIAFACVYVLIIAAMSLAAAGRQASRSGQ